MKSNVGTSLSADLQVVARISREERVCWIANEAHRDTVEAIVMVPRLRELKQTLAADPELSQRIHTDRAIAYR